MKSHASSYLSKTTTLIFPAFTFSFLLKQALCNSFTALWTLLALSTSNSVICKQICHHRPTTSIQPKSCTSISPRGLRFTPTTILKNTKQQWSYYASLFHSHSNMKTHWVHLPPSHMYLLLYENPWFLPITTHPHHKFSEHSTELPYEPYHILSLSPWRLHSF